MFALSIRSNWVRTINVTLYWFHSLQWSVFVYIVWCVRASCCVPHFVTIQWGEGVAGWRGPPFVRCFDVECRIRSGKTGSISPIHCAQGRPCHTATRLSGCCCDWWFAFYYILLIYIGAVGAYNDTTRFDDVSYSLCQLNCQCVMYIKQSIHHFFYEYSV